MGPRWAFNSSPPLHFAAFYDSIDRLRLVFVLSAWIDSGGVFRPFAIPFFSHCDTSSLLLPLRSILGAAGLDSDFNTKLLDMTARRYALNV